MYPPDASVNSQNRISPKLVYYITYTCPYTGETINKWVFREYLKFSPVEFFENDIFIDMSKSLKTFNLYD